MALGKTKIKPDKNLGYVPHALAMLEAAKLGNKDAVKFIRDVTSKMVFSGMPVDCLLKVYEVVIGHRMKEIKEQRKKN